MKPKMAQASRTRASHRDQRSPAVRTTAALKAIHRAMVARLDLKPAAGVHCEVNAERLARRLHVRARTAGIGVAPAQETSHCSSEITRCWLARRSNQRAGGP